MKVRAVRSFTDRYSMESIRIGAEMEISEERFSELTTGPRGIFVEEIVVDPPVDPPNEQAQDEVHPEDEKPVEPVKEEDPPSKELPEVEEPPKRKHKR